MTYKGEINARKQMHYVHIFYSLWSILNIKITQNKFLSYFAMSGAVCSIFQVPVVNNKESLSEAETLGRTRLMLNSHLL